MDKLPIVVLISGSGSNLQAIIDAIDRGLAAAIKAVISNRADAYGLERAQTAGIPTHVLDHSGFPDRDTFDNALQSQIDAYRPSLVVLAGFMRILGAAFVNRYHGRLFNIHPSLLPQFPGLNTHQRALDVGVNEHGASVHFVTNELDGGPMVIQAKVQVLPNDDAETLASRVLEREHQIYPQAIRWFAEGRLKLQDNRVLLDNQAVQLEHPVDLDQT